MAWKIALKIEKKILFASLSHFSEIKADNFWWIPPQGFKFNAGLILSKEYYVPLKTFIEVGPYNTNKTTEENFEILKG